MIHLRLAERFKRLDRQRGDLRPLGLRDRTAPPP
jgi:hypothetical protein